MRARKGIRIDDGVARCWWCGEHADYRAYHDDEWGRPTTSDEPLFETLTLELFQSGLSWLTILRKREGFRRAFAGFDLARVARFGARERTRLLADAGIVRHAGKIDAAIVNAKRARELIAEAGSLAAHVWSFAPPASERPRKMTHAALSKLSQTPASRALSKDLRKRGWKFVGPTTCYSFMQAAGVVNDHLEGCAVREAVERERAAWRTASKG